jgi:hypothetical protein
MVRVRGPNYKCFPWGFRLIMAGILLSETRLYEIETGTWGAIINAVWLVE